MGGGGGGGDSAGGTEFLRSAGKGATGSGIVESLKAASSSSHALALFHRHPTGYNESLDQTTRISLVKAPRLSSPAWRLRVPKHRLGFLRRVNGYTKVLHVKERAVRMTPVSVCEGFEESVSRVYGCLI